MELENNLVSIYTSHRKYNQEILKIKNYILYDDIYINHGTVGGIENNKLWNIIIQRVYDWQLRKIVDWYDRKYRRTKFIYKEL
ncbi:6037_t:CDS:2 [Diversispora eburnea]|uniref:6037_t:CDS:1 n=1 Tax=Diversispora eburnea TaxID=1213867 RepID=A0A9N9AWT6_9GLOM|nr:6037_t:CDS:2 [Diversispora eburnea]